MADNNNQQKGGNQQKAAPGINVSMGVSPSDLTPRTLSGMFSIGVAALGGILILSKAHGFLSKHLFGVKPDDKPAIEMNPGTVVNYMKSGAATDSNLKHIAKEAFGQMTNDAKKSMAEFFQRELPAITGNNNTGNNN